MRKTIEGMYEKSKNIKFLEESNICMQGREDKGLDGVKSEQQNENKRDNNDIVTKQVTRLPDEEWQHTDNEERPIFTNHDTTLNKLFSMERERIFKKIQVSWKRKLWLIP